MGLHYKGYEKAISNVATMTKGELYAVLDCLFGRDNLPNAPTLEDLQNEVYRQMDIDWTDPTSEEYQTRQLWKTVIDNNSSL